MVYHLQIWNPHNIEILYRSLRLGKPISNLSLKCGSSARWYSMRVLLYTYIQIHYLEMLYLNSTLNFGIPPVLVFQLVFYYIVYGRQTFYCSTKRNNCSMVFKWNISMSSYESQGFFSYLDLGSCISLIIQTFDCFCWCLKWETYLNIYLLINIGYSSRITINYNYLESIKSKNNQYHFN